MEEVFVYGTLKQGHPNHYLMSSGEDGVATFRYHATTTTSYPLIITGPCHCPYLLDAPTRGEHVEGEVYGVDATMLKRLDKLEQVPVLYQRDKITVTVAQDTNEETPETRECWVYILRNYRPELDMLPTIKNYDENSVIGFIPPRDRTPDMFEKQTQSVKLN